MSDAGGLAQRVRAGGLLVAGAPVVVLLSGGRDSVCLLDIAVTICGVEAVRALHVDYALREGSEQDAAACEELCARLGVGLDVMRPEAPEGGNLQGWARDVRYARASELALAHSGDVAAAHTATDQAETVLYRLASSPSRRALLGMAARSGRLVRPLLGVTREETTAFCQSRGLPWRDDPSNETDRFARGRVRHGLLAALREVHPGAQDNIVRTAALLRDEAAVLDEVVSTALQGRDQIALSRLRELPPALARLVVVRLAEDVAGALVPRAGSRTDEILGLDSARARTALDLGDGVRAVAEHGLLHMEFTSPAAPTLTLE